MAIRSLMFLKEMGWDNKSGKIGRWTTAYIMQNISVIISTSQEHFLPAYMNDHMLLEVKSEDMIAKLDPPIYRRHIWYNKQCKPMLYKLPSNIIHKSEKARRSKTKLILTIEPDENHKLCVVISDAVQLDVKSNNRIYITIGKGEAYTVSCKQKLALVALNDVMWQIQW